LLKYKNIVIFTRTLWSESPRIRHQLTRLLVSRGHEITFFERASVRQLQTINHDKEGIHFIKHLELLHHQLRPFKFLVYINNMITKLLIKSNIEIKEIDLIINFNYDYDFLNDLKRNKKIVTIINDDFVAQAKPWMKKSIKKQLESTCKNSDIVFVIHSLQYQELKPFNRNTYRLFPWADKYIPPVNKDCKRNIVLFWGFIDQRVDWVLIETLLKNSINIRFIGPILNRVKYMIKKFEKYDNFELYNATPIKEIDFKDVMCSIIPYNININGVKSISISNRTLQLLSYGIPIVHTALPDLIEAPDKVITKCSNSEEFLNAIEYFENNFYLCQKEIEIFLENHYEETRYDYIFNKIKEL
jgi:hypothetical protein